MPQILFLIPISFIIILLGLIVFIIFNIPKFELKTIGLLMILSLVTCLFIPLSASFAQYKSEVDVKVTQNNKIIHQYKNVHSFNNRGEGVYSMTDRKNKSFKIFVNDGQKLHVSDPKTYNPHNK